MFFYTYASFPPQKGGHLTVLPNHDIIAVGDSGTQYDVLPSTAVFTFAPVTGRFLMMFLNAVQYSIPEYIYTLHCATLGGGCTQLLHALVPSHPTRLVVIL